MKSAVLIIFTAAFLIGAEIHPVEPTGLTVHEWGTFTSVAGEDGSAIDWNTLGCRSDLPGFVYTLGFGSDKWRLQGAVRMETPVLYFYSSRELDAHVKVAFPQGVMTEWYPRASLHEIYQKNSFTGSVRRLDGNLNGFDTSLRSLTGTIEWRDIKIRPDTAPTLPVESGPNRYYAARGTDAAPITISGQHEKFLFYRGVGRFPVPLSARLSSDGKIVVENRGQDPIATVILFENHGGRLGYRNAGPIGEVVQLAPPSLDGSFPQLRRDLETALVREGLFPKEAQAMVETWRDSWFEEGSRLIYIVPSRSVDAILPLEVEPAPSQTARVFVGRIELITPVTTGLVREAIDKKNWSTVASYARFLDPILKHIYAGNSSRIEQIRQNIQAWIGAGYCR